MYKVELHYQKQPLEINACCKNPALFSLNNGYCIPKGYKDK